MHSRTRFDSLSFSVYEEGTKEAQKHKWIESQKRGYDRGQLAILEWFQVHWPGFVRSCKLEHSRGYRRWVEFQQESFGSLSDLIEQNDLLAELIIDRICSGCENLDILLWAQNWGLPSQKVVWILSQIDINAARLDPINI